MNEYVCIMYLYPFDIEIAFEKKRKRVSTLGWVEPEQKLLQICIHSLSILSDFHFPCFLASLPEKIDVN